MQPYQNYYPAMYQQNSYPNYQQNYGNTIPGRVVNDFNEITANEIPMDGRMATFVKSDLSEVVLRKWENNGTITNLRFKAFCDTDTNNLPKETEKSQNGANNDVLECIMNDIKSLNDKVDKLAKPARARKEESNES